ncbi:hypothetical protein ABIC52_000416 [Curtobacterium oceanosedimentum]
MTLTIGTRFAACPICVHRGRTTDCAACYGTGRIAQIAHTRQEPSA